MNIFSIIIYYYRRFSFIPQFPVNTQYEVYYFTAAYWSIINFEFCWFWLTRVRFLAIKCYIFNLVETGGKLLGLNTFGKMQNMMLLFALFYERHVLELCFNFQINGQKIANCAFGTNFVKLMKGKKSKNIYQENFYLQVLQLIFIQIYYSLNILNSLKDVLHSVLFW